MRRDGGFTLLEVIVSLVIAGSALAVMLVSLSSGLESTDRSALVEEALSHAQSHLDSAMAMPRLLTGTQKGDDGDGFRWQMETRQLAVVNPAARHPLALFAVDIAIHWGVNGHVQLTGRRIAPMMPGTAQ